MDISRAQLTGIEVFQDLANEDLAEIERTLRLLPVARGQALIRQGEPAGALYIVASGRFKVVRDNAAQPIAEIGAGQPIGEIAFFAGGLRTATVIAERDSLVYELEREAFDRLVAGSPRILATITAQLARRLGEATKSGAIRPPGTMRPRTIAICRAGGVQGQAGLVEQFTRQLRDGFPSSARVHVVDAQSASRLLDGGIALSSSEATQVFNRLESQHDHVVYLADPELTEWSKKALRQADVVLCVAANRDHASQEPNLLEHFAEQLHGPGILRLVLIQHGPTPYHGTRSWLEPRPWIGMHHHVRLGSAGADTPETSGIARIVRFVRGEARGLVACGGGAFCAAHIGVFDAIREAGLSFDIVGGASGGAAMTAALALGVAEDEIARRTEDIFITRRAMRRWTWPRYGLLDHIAFDRALADHFTDVEIEDLEIPYFAVATNLTRGSVECITRGSLWRAVRASAAIPAMLPPVFNREGEMLVDGCVAENTPVGTIRRLKGGPNVVIDFASPEPERQAIDTSTLPSRNQILAKVLTGRSQHLPSAPGPQSVLMRALTLNGPRRTREAEACDIVLTPPIPPDVGHLDWHRHRELRARAAEYAARELTRLKADGHPMTISQSLR